MSHIFSYKLIQLWIKVSNTREYRFMKKTFVNFRKSSENWYRSAVFQFFPCFFLVDWQTFAIFVFSRNCLFRRLRFTIESACDMRIKTFAAIFNNFDGTLSAPVAFLWFYYLWFYFILYDIMISLSCLYLLRKLWEN